MAFRGKIGDRQFRSKKEFYAYLKELQIKKQNQAKEDQQKLDQLPPKEEYDDLQNRVDDMSKTENERLKENREGHKDEARQDLETDIKGLTPAQKQAMTETANKQLHNHLTNYSRMISSNAGASGLRGGAANALQNELYSQGLDARNQFMRDLTEKDSELAMQKLAAYLSMVEGKTAQDILQRQQFQDYLIGERDKKKQDAYSGYFSKYFKRV